MKKLYINSKKWYNKNVVEKTKKEVTNMFFDENAFLFSTCNDIEYLPSIFDGKIDKEMLI